MMNSYRSGMKHLVLIAGLALSVAACGEKEAEGVASDGSVMADPHASLAAAADVMKSAPADQSAATTEAPAAGQQ